MNIQAALKFRAAITALVNSNKPCDPAPSTDPFALILWENVCYLASPARRREAFQLLQSEVGLTPQAILAAGQAMLERVTAHGILKTTFAEKLRLCAQIALDRYGGDVAAAIERTPAKAKRILRAFPGIGAPGADKILLFMGIGADLAPESNGLRVLQRLGVIDAEKSYARAYQAALIATKDALDDNAALQEAHLRLAQHGRDICKTTRPHCGQCLLNTLCAYSQTILG